MGHGTQGMSGSEFTGYDKTDILKKRFGFGPLKNLSQRICLAIERSETPTARRLDGRPGGGICPVFPPTPFLSHAVRQKHGLRQGHGNVRRTLLHSREAKLTPLAQTDHPLDMPSQPNDENPPDKAPTAPEARAQIDPPGDRPGQPPDSGAEPVAESLLSMGARQRRLGHQQHGKPGKRWLAA